MSACNVLGEIKYRTREHRDDCQNLVATFKIRANNEHLCKLRDVRHVASVVHKHALEGPTEIPP